MSEPKRCRHRNRDRRYYAQRRYMDRCVDCGRWINGTQSMEPERAPGRRSARLGDHGDKGRGWRMGLGAWNR